MKKKTTTSASLLTYAAILSICAFILWAGYSWLMITQQNTPIDISSDVETKISSEVSSVQFDKVETIAPVATSTVVSEVVPSTAQSSATISSYVEDMALVGLRQKLGHFESTLKSCLGRYCIDISFPTGKNGAKQDRYGLLGPSSTAHKSKLFQSLSALNTDGSVFIESTHVPTYGYGKNHGWTRIVRLLDNVAVQAYKDIEPHYLNKVESASLAVTMEEAYAAQLRALLRWHCRLNHVAAHTSMLTVSHDFLVSNPHFAAQSIVSFFNAKDPKPFLDNFLVTETLQSLVFSSYSSLPRNLWRTASEVIDDEMIRSRNMTKWPCLSFKELRGHLVTQEHRIWAPNCSRDSAGTGAAAYPKCSVQYDFAEQ